MVADVFRRLSPRDFHPDAVPQSSVPSATVITNTTNAINAMGLTTCIQEYERGAYYVDGTISPSGGSADTSLGKKQVYFNNTEIRVPAGASIAGFQEVINQAGTGGLAGLVEPSGNLPPGEKTPVIFDVTNTEQSVYSGNLFINGGTSAMGLCAIAACNRNVQDGVGGLEAIWGHVQIASCRWGLFGTPRYGLSRTYYSGAFVGNVFQKLRIDPSVTFPLLIGANQIDDCYIAQYQQPTKAGGGSYLYLTALKCGTIYVNGASASDYAFNIENSHLIFGTMYAEKNFKAPIRAGITSWVEGTCKYGAGGTTVFAKKAFVYNDAVSGGGNITSHERTSPSTDAVSLVLLKSVAGAKRNYSVNAPFLESDVLPFAMEAGTGALPQDKLISFFRDGQATWTPAGSSAAPTLTRSGAAATLPIAESDVTNLVSDLAAKQPLDSDLTAIAALAPANDNVMQRKAGAWVGSTPATVKTDLALTKSDVGLGSVDNTADTAKPVSTAQATALALKANLAGDTFSGNVNIDRTGAAASANLQIKGDAGFIRHLSGYTGANLRWQLRLGNASTETGTGNTGSDFVLQAYDDAGAALGSVYTITRSTRVMDFAVAPTVAGVGLEKVGTRRAINTQTASYTLVLGDEGKVVEMNNASAVNLTVPLNATAAFALNTWIDVSQYGVGQVTIVPAGGVTMRSAGGLLKTRVQYSGVTLVKRGTDEWYVFGDLG